MDSIKKQVGHAILFGLASANVLLNIGMKEASSGQMIHAGMTGIVLGFCYLALKP